MTKKTGPREPSYIDNAQVVNTCIPYNEQRPRSPLFPTVPRPLNQLGFTDRTHFYELFRAEYGMTPKQFRQNTKT